MKRGSYRTNNFPGFKASCMIVLMAAAAAFFLAASPSRAADFDPAGLRDRVDAIIASPASAAFPYADDVAFSYHADLKNFLSRLGPALDPRPVLVDGRLAKHVVMCRLSDNAAGTSTIGAAAGAPFQFAADGTLISLPEWESGFRPGYVVPLDKWMAAKTVNEIPALAELVPSKLQYSAGPPVEPGVMKDAYFVRGAVGRLPFKNQEEKEEWIARNDLRGEDGKPLKAHSGRRTGSSKCLSYAASTVADYWALMAGSPSLPSYSNYLSGVVEYGHDPRMVENIYHVYRRQKPSRYWYAPVGKDRVTGEKMPWSIKAFVELLYNARNMDFSDRFRPSEKWSLGPDGFHMDLPPVRMFKGVDFDKAKDLKEGLEKFGILYAQHTNRLFNDKIPVVLMGVHAVAIVGYFTHEGKDYFVYQESFGPKHGMYFEDSIGGPRYRAMTAQFFYQAWGFPHTLRSDVKSSPAGLVFVTRSHEGRPIPVDSVTAASRAGKVVSATLSPDGSYFLPAPAGGSFRVTIARKHFIPLVLDVIFQNGNVAVKKVDTENEYLKGYKDLD